LASKSSEEGGRGALALLTIWAFILIATWVALLLVMSARGLYSGA